MTEQEIFNKIATHLLTQNEKAIDPILQSCRYQLRVENGKILKCAMGCLIPDELYNPNLEAKSINLLPEYILEAMGVKGVDISFLVKLQRLHDHNNPEMWKLKLKEIAQEFKLDATV